MSQSLSSLTNRLQSLVTPRNSIPTSDQYTSVIKDAVADLSRRAPLTRITTLAVLSGQASYTLPSDFLRLISLPSLGNPSGVFLASSGIIPVGASFCERYTIAGQTLTFTPAPAYTLTRQLVYAAGYTLDEGGTYVDLTDDRAALVLLKAQAIALLIQANRAALDGWKYIIDDESVDKTAVPTALRAQAQLLQAEYEAALKTQAGPVVRRGAG